MYDIYLQNSQFKFHGVSSNAPWLIPKLRGLHNPYLLTTRIPQIYINFCETGRKNDYQ